MANLSYSNTPLIADLYDTPEAALAASAGLGCNGYRTYNINGQNKYVPCATYLAYEQALRFVKRQGVLNAISGNGNIGDKAVGLQFANNNNEIAGDPFFTLGNFSLLDVVDDNAYAKDPRTQFLNWGNMTYSAFDYAADSWGFTPSTY